MVVLKIGKNGNIDILSNKFFIKTPNNYTMLFLILTTSNISSLNISSILTEMSIPVSTIMMD